MTPKRMGLNDPCWMRLLKMVADLDPLSRTFDCHTCSSSSAPKNSKRRHLCRLLIGGLTRRLEKPEKRYRQQILIPAPALSGELSCDALSACEDRLRDKSLGGEAIDEEAPYLKDRALQGQQERLELDRVCKTINYNINKNFLIFCESGTRDARNRTKNR